MINFTRLSYKNFLSTGNVPTVIDLNNSKTSLIIGKNGAGKSSITDSIAYVLFNKPFRKINKPQLINSINKKELLVEIEFVVGSLNYKVIRGMRPGIFEIYQNGVMLNQDAASKDYQEVLEKQILKMNYKTFCQVVILGSASFVPFMQLSTGQRREITEDVLDLQIFSIMNTLLKEKVSNNASLVKDVEYEIKLLNQRILMQEKHIESFMKDTDTLIEDLNKKIKSYRSNILKENDNILNNNKKRDLLLSSVNDDPSKITNRLAKINVIHSQLSDKIIKLNDDVHFYRDHDTCPTCQQSISDDFKQHHLHVKEDNINATKQGIEKLLKEMEKTQKKLDEVNKIYDECSRMNIDNSVSFSSIQSLENHIKTSLNEIEKLKNKKETYKHESTDLSQLDKENDKLISKKKKLLKEKELHSVSLAMLKDNGIKSKIIKQYVPIINKYINMYLSAMDFFISFELDENFNETIKSRFRDDFGYTSFSEGEKSRINLAVLFAWRTIAKLRNSAATNLLIFDEIFDGSLDVDGTEEFMKLLNAAAPDSNVFVISHKTDAMLDRFDRVIKFEKVKNFSEIAE